MSEYWVARDGERYGPYTHDQLVEYYKSGQVLPTDQVCRPGTQEWVIASSMSELSDNTPPAAPATAKPSAPTGVVPSIGLAGPILVTLFCCLPFGVVSIVYATQVPTKVAANDMAGAELAAKTARSWMNWGFIIGLVVNVLVWGFYAVLVIAGAASNSN